MNWSVVSNSYSTKVDAKGSQALITFLREASPAKRKAWLAKLSAEDRLVVATLLGQLEANPWSQYANDPVGFIEEGLGETLWSKQREILESVKNNKRTAVPACHAPGKSHLSARIVAWWVMTHAKGTAQVVTTATSFRQVRNILWSHIRRLHATHNLDGDCLMVEWKIATDTVAFGFAPAQYNETALQGIHAPNLLIVVDEAGGISDTIGTALEALMTGGNTRLLLLGNPPTDNENSWFERACRSDLYNTIKIGALDTPNFTGEETGLCTTCPRSVPPHQVSTHLVDQQWVKDVIQELGDTSPFVEARVHANFPKVTGNRIIPSTWIEEALNNTNPAHSHQINLGVDVAADGGDEFVIARTDGYTARIIHTSSGAENASAITVANTILHHIREAEQDAQHLTDGNPQNIHYTHETHTIQPFVTPDTHPTGGGGSNPQTNTPPSTNIVSVKIDAIGLGWGVVSLLREWGLEGRHNARIVGVNVAERAVDAGKFKNQRAEMWWNGRVLLQPDVDGFQLVRLCVDRKVAGQLSAPDFMADSSGRIKVVSKDELRKKGLGSPDRAEAILLALYEPKGFISAPIVAPFQLPQTNVWSI
jgi:hypothetical protein